MFLLAFEILFVKKLDLLNLFFYTQPFHIFCSFRCWTFWLKMKGCTSTISCITKHSHVSLTDTCISTRCSTLRTKIQPLCETHHICRYSLGSSNLPSPPPPCDSGFTSVPTSMTCQAKNWLQSSPPACSRLTGKRHKKPALLTTSSETTLHSSVWVQNNNSSKCCRSR